LLGVALADTGAIDRTAAIGGAANASLWRRANTGSANANPWSPDTRRCDGSGGNAGGGTQHHAWFCDAALRHPDIFAIHHGVCVGRGSHRQGHGRGKGYRGKGVVQDNLLTDRRYRHPTPDRKASYVISA
jgi:hypothetical protein